MMCWKTKLPDGSKCRKHIAKTTLESLGNFMVDYYKAMCEEQETLQSIYAGHIHSVTSLTEKADVFEKVFKPKAV